MISPLFLILACTTAAYAKTVKQDLHLVTQTVSPDGFPREAILPGGKFGGTLIKANKGDTLEINVINGLYDPKLMTTTTIHWHGIHMRTTQWADGAAAVTQCPIMPNESFNYVLDTSNAVGPAQSGTFWYHSHLWAQYCDGLRGPMVIYDPEDAKRYNYDVDDESTIISLFDWYHTYGGEFVPGAGLHPFPQTSLINGKGRQRDSTNSNSELAVITVQHGKRYRMRVIDMSCLSPFTYSVDKHVMQIIEADSISTKPHFVDSFKIYPGQRYSYVLNANQTVGNYWMRSLSDADPLGAYNYTGNTNVAILRYIGAPHADPTPAADVNVPVLTNTLNENELEPYTDANAPGGAALSEVDVSLKLVNTFNASGNNLFEVNGTAFSPPAVPVLLQILSGARSAHDLLPQGSVFTLPRNKTVEITIVGTSEDTGGPHPYHLHGHDFYLVKSSDSQTPKFMNPVQRDTASTGLNDNSMTIRFRTDNPGPWFLHCHNDWHIEMGMGVLFAEDASEIPYAMSKPSAQWDKLCPVYDKYIDQGGIPWGGDSGWKSTSTS